MKQFKTLVALVLALALTLTLVGSAMAASITIKKTNQGQTYEFYKLFDATVDPARVDGGEGISYKLRSGITDFKATVDGSVVDGATWFELDTGNNVVAKSGLNEEALKSDTFKAWAKAYGEKLTGKTVTGNGSDQTVSELDDGYYFITTTTGTLVTIDSIGPNEEVEDKNPPTTIDKEIMDSDTAGDTGSVTTDKEAALAQVGRTVAFEVRIPIENGAINYVFEDIMSAGLTLNPSSLTVALATTATGEAGSALTPSTEYADSQSAENKTATDALDIEIHFKNSWVKANEGKYIVINYTGTVNKDAVIVDASNPNKATIKWGDTTNPLHDDDTVEVWSAKVKVIKIDGDGAPLAGAGFVLKNAAGKYYSWDATNGVVWVDTEAEATEYTTAVVGQGATAEASVEFKGLANGTYTLHEKTVPTGYNAAADKDVTINAAAESIPTLTVEATVENKKGTELPSTGGIGTTIFYIAGAVLVLGAAAIVIARRKAEQR